MKAILFVLMFFLLGTGEGLKAKDKKPNILFLLTDDQRYNTLGCMGNEDIHTPNIDGIAEKGILFTKYYNTTAICMGSRATIMTGQYEFNSGCNFSHGPLKQEKFDYSYPMLLKKAGYRTGFAGKFGFAVVSGDMKDNSDYHSMDRLPVDQFDWWRGWPGQGYYETEKNEYMIPYAKKYPHVSKALGAAASEFIMESGKSSQPFCLSVSFKAPHGPVRPDPEYDSVYMGKDFKEPCNFGEQGAVHLPLQAKSDRQYQRLKYQWLGGKYDEAIAKYYQQIFGVDVAVGMILDALEKSGQAGNTIIIFTSDNGYFCGSHALGGKVLPYEEGSRAPLIIYDPRSKSAGKGWKTDALSGNIDIAPTILEMAGAKNPGNMDGVSLLPLLKNPGKEVKDDQLFVQAWGADALQSMTVIHDHMKYIYWYYGEGMDPAEELYDLNEKCMEMTNLVNDPAMSGELADMRKRYDSYLELWKQESIPNESYEKYNVLFDRNISWDEKKDLVRSKK